MGGVEGLVVGRQRAVEVGVFDAEGRVRGRETVEDLLFLRARAVL